MCGIAGFLSRRPDLPEILAARATVMADSLIHRGPDDRGVWVESESGLGLGHRRLSILDCTEAGHQPMISADGRYVLSYNGEVYNAPEFAAELDGAGVVRRGHSDTEVILEAFARWGVKTILPRLAGMFAFALWDRAERVLTLARDPMGIKPLYWGKAPDGTILFGSELKALRVHPSWDFAIDPDAVASYLTYGYVPAPASIYLDVQKLPPGHLLTLTADASPRLEAYWRLDQVAVAGQANPLTLSDHDATDALESLLRQVVHEHEAADVPLGAFLSGGIDSSTVTALMGGPHRAPVRSFTIGFDDEGYDESAHAAAVAAHLGCSHTELRLRAKAAMEVIPKLSEMYDEPFADSSQIPTYLVSEMTRRKVTVVLSGDGGDELFAGYNRHVWGETIQAKTAGVPRVLRHGAASLLTSFSADGWDSLIGRLPGMPRLLGNKLHKLAGALRAEDGGAMYRSLVSFWPDAGAMVPGGGRVNPGPAVPDGLGGLVEAFQYLDAATYLPDDILVKVDRASMGVSLESRVPLLDRRVVEFAWRLPRHQRLRDGQSKWLLRQVLYRHVPRELVERPKMGFALPIGAWLRGPLKDWADDLLSDAAFAHGFIDPTVVRQRWAEHLAGKGSWDHHLWIILMFNDWARRWL